MSNFFDRFKPGGGSKKNGGNPFANLLPGAGATKFSGQGQSLGGSQPGKVIPITLSEPGTLGIKLEKRPNDQGTAIVASVVAGSQAEKAAIQRGDVLCFTGSNGAEEIMYDMFIELAASNQRPLCFEVRRVQSKAASTADGSGKSKASAETYARKQAVIAAAEARERAHKKKTKPIPKTKKDNLPTMLSTADRQRLEEERQARAQELAQQEPKSEASRQAVQAAKEKEAQVAAELGYNPYEISRATAGQARTATTAQKHGTIQQETEDAPLPEVRPPTEIPQTEDAVPPSPAFLEAYEIVVTSNDHAVVVSSFGILRKLIVNATTKGQQLDDEASAKFRRVRLANAKIKAAIVNVEGALDLMLSTGFEVAEEDGGESVLVFPPGAEVYDWIPIALGQMEGCEKS